MSQSPLRSQQLFLIAQRMNPRTLRVSVRSEFTLKKPKWSPFTPKPEQSVRSSGKCILPHLVLINPL